MPNYLVKTDEKDETQGVYKEVIQNQGEVSRDEALKWEITWKNVIKSGIIMFTTIMYYTFALIKIYCLSFLLKF